MSGTCGPTCGTPFARYDPGSSSWRTSEATSLWDLTLSSLTLPPWGCLRGGELSEHPTPELRTVALGSSSPPGGLPTPTARDSKGSDLPSRRGGPSLPSFVTMLPTPRTSDANGSGAHGDGGLDLRTKISLLATPSVMDMGSSYSPEEWEAWRQEQRRNHANGNGHGESLTQQAMSMLPTPKAADGERGRDVARARPDEKSRELATVVSVGVSTSPRSADGSTSLDDQHPHLPFPEPPDATGSTPCSSSG